MTNQEILNIEFDCGDLDKKVTIRQYFKELLLRLWREGEGFSGKRPLGNSCWEYDVYDTLVKAGVISGETDDDGDVIKRDLHAAEEKVLELINEL